MKRKPTTIIQEHDLVPLTEKLYSEFSVEELEIRLETDPLLLSSLFDLDNTRGCTCKNECVSDCTCKGTGSSYCNGQCTELSVEL